MRSLVRRLAFCLLCVAAAPAQEPVSELDRAIEEFKRQTRDLKESSGITAGGAQKAGPGVEWHGRVYEYFRNDFLDAVPHEVAQRGGAKSVLRRNQFGFSVSGPLLIPGLLPRAGETFFTVTYEGVRESIARSRLLTVPILPERNGDYSTVVDAAGRVLEIYDPATTALNPAFDSSRPVTRENLQYNRLPFSDNRIPAFRLDSVARNALSYYPAPNASAGPFFRNNYFVNSPERNTPDGVIIKIDQPLKARHRLSSLTSTSCRLAPTSRS
jgi:hypothetical protein